MKKYVLMLLALLVITSCSHNTVNTIPDSNSIEETPEENIEEANPTKSDVQTERDLQTKVGNADENSIQTEQTKSNRIDNDILTLVLTDLHDGMPENTFIVVNPIAKLINYDDIDSKQIWLTNQLQEEGYKADELVTAFFSKNLQPIELTLKSNEKYKFIVDSKNEYEKYFLNGVRSWSKLVRDHPDFGLYVRVSLPVRTKDNFILIYYDFQQNWDAAEGCYILYKLEYGKLKEIKRLIAWVV